MKNKHSILKGISFGLAAAALCAAAADLGAGRPLPPDRRPYEFRNAGRDKDDVAPLVDFEDGRAWRATAADAEAFCEITQEELDSLEEAGALRNVARMPARVKCAVLGWRTLEHLLTQQAGGD